MRLLVSDVGREAVAQLDAWGAESPTWLEPGGPVRPAGVVGLGDGRIVGQFDRPTGLAVIEEP